MILPGESVAAPRVAVLVVTGDDSLWAPLAAVTEGREAQQFDSVAELVGSWSASRAAVVLVDARSADSLEGGLQRLVAHSTALVPVAIVDDASRTTAAALERKRALFDHVLLPLDAGTARTVLDRAADEAAARLTLAAGDSAKRPARPTGGARGRSRGPWLLAAAAVIAAASGVAWWLTRPVEAPAVAPAHEVRAAPATPAAAPSPADAARPAEEKAAPAEAIEAQLERARAAMRDKRYIEPATDNALAHYKTVLDLDPQNGEARQGLDRIAELLIARATTAMANKDYAVALKSLEAARSVKPDHPRLAALDQQVNQRYKDLSAAQVQAALQANAFARAAALLAQAEKTAALPPDQIAQLRAEAARREAGAELAEFARVAQVRISQGRLLEPAGDSAKYYLKQLQDRGGAPVADVLARLGDAYAKRLASDAHAALSRAAWPEFDALVAELKIANGGASLGQAQALQKEAERAREQKLRAAEAAEAKPSADAAREAAAAAAPAAPAAPAAVTPPKLIKALTLDYPMQAAAAGIEGWVEVQFDVATTGVPEKVRVVASQPAGTFDSAALAAIRRARFTPARTADGTPVVQATALKLRFALNNHR